MRTVVRRLLQYRQYQTAVIGHIWEDPDTEPFLLERKPDEDPKIYTSPAYAHIPGNIFHELLYLSQLETGKD